MEIRPIRPDECELVGDIIVDAYRDLAGGDALGTYETELRAVAERSVECLVLVGAGDDGTLLGTVTYVPGPDTDMSEFTDPEAAGIRMLAVSPRHQGLGTGRALTEACIAIARSEGRRRILLHSTPLMLVARAMYERLGFVARPELDIRWTEPPYDEDDPLHLIAYALEL